MAIARVRVELKKKYNDHDRNFREMFQDFKRTVSKSGILHEFREHQFYESKTEKKRKQKRSSAKKRQMEALEKRILAGERVLEPAGLVKKITSAIKSEKKEKKEKKDRKPKRFTDD